MTPVERLRQAAQAVEAANRLTGYVYRDTALAFAPALAAAVLALLDADGHDAGLCRRYGDMAPDDCPYCAALAAAAAMLPDG